MMKEKRVSQGSCFSMATPFAHSAASFSHSESVRDMTSRRISSKSVSMAK